MRESILFNTDMVRAILNGSKTVTRRPNINGFPYPINQEIYVRETWADRGDGTFMYKADYSDTEKFYRDGQEIRMKWKPSIHMPREAARLYLMVDDVYAERVRDITEDEAKKEGFASRQEFLDTFLNMYPDLTEDSFVWVIRFRRL